ncbi:MAG: restriction endonuclease, partial [Planctomycetota bacterium]|nr:restriction endonuclease [Planctomycetota bacterium]
MSALAQLRREYHQKICAELLALRGDDGVPNIADGSSPASVDFAKRLVDKLGFELAAKKLSGQTIGQRFAELTKDFLFAAFEKVRHLRPGDWIVSTSQAGQGIAAYDQYEHLARLQALLADKPDLKTALGGDYIITPDIIIARNPEPDERINATESVVQEGPVASLAPLRRQNTPNPHRILHASISCKWTMRSDRAQNTRTEALNLIRNRKGNTPHIVAVTF